MPIVQAAVVTLLVAAFEPQTEHHVSLMQLRQGAYQGMGEANSFMENASTGSSFSSEGNRSLGGMHGASGWQPAPLPSISVELVDTSTGSSFRSESNGGLAGVQDAHEEPLDVFSDPDEALRALTAAAAAGREAAHGIPVRRGQLAPDPERGFSGSDQLKQPVRAPAISVVAASAGSSSRSRSTGPLGAAQTAGKEAREPAEAEDLATFSDPDEALRAAAAASARAGQVFISVQLMEEPLCPDACKCSSSNGPDGLAVNAEGYCVAMCSQEHNFGAYGVLRFCGDGDHYQIGDFLNCTGCSRGPSTAEPAPEPAPASITPSSTPSPTAAATTPNPADPHNAAP